MKLSIIIPVFNEEKTITEVLKKVTTLHFKNTEKEIIVVNDGSTDKTLQKIESFLRENKSSIKLINQSQNHGKGAAVITGLQKATGEYSIIQDADLEYNPFEIQNLLDVLLQKKAKIVFGTRLKRLPHFTKEEKRVQFFIHYIGNKFLSFLTSILYGQWITDMETCYKLFPTKTVQKLKLRAKGFEFEPEITSKLLKMNLKIYEIPITTIPRGYDKGKKLNTVRDGVKAVWTLIKYRFVD